MIEYRNTINVLEDYADLLATNYKNALIETGSVASSTLVNSVTTSVKVGTNRISVVMELADYWKWVEDGRKPGKFPPVDNIINWIQVKPIIPQPYQIPSGREVTPTEKQLAYLIGRKIANEGIEGKHQLSETNDALFEQFRERITEALIQDISEEISIIYTVLT